MSREFPLRGTVKVAQESQESIKEKIKGQYPIADSSEAEPDDPKERAKRLKRGNKYTGKATLVGPQLVQSSEGYNWPADFKPVPVSASAVIVVGTISDAKAHLSEDKNSVYSEFAVRIDEVLKNESGLPLAPGQTVILERKGGRVRYPSGHVSWLYLIGQGLPRLSARYVFFLSTTDEEGLFDPLTGYEIRDGRIEPLDYSPGVVGFQRYSGSDATSFVNEIRSNIASPQPKN
jgi:hypothetical protein